MPNGEENQAYNANPESGEGKYSDYELEDFSGVRLPRQESSHIHVCKESQNLLELLSLQRKINDEEASCGKGRKKFVYPSILRALAGVVGKDFIICGIYKVFTDIVTLQIPSILGLARKHYYIFFIIIEVGLYT